jgi:hypothetical protein
LRGDTINGAVIEGISGSSVVFFAPGSAGSSMRRLTIRNAGLAKPASGAVSIYGSSVTLSNLVIEDCGVGVSINESSGVVLENLTFDGDTIHAIRSRYSTFSLKDAVTAVIYADDSDRPEFATAAPQTRAKFAELLHQHAALVLLSVEVSEKAAAEIREFDALLVEEIEYVHNTDVKAGKNAIERQQTLRHNVEHARRMHGERTRQAAKLRLVHNDHRRRLSGCRTYPQHRRLDGAGLHGCG